MDCFAPENFVLLGSVMPGIMMDIRYFTSYNFVGERIDGYEQPAAILTQEAAAALSEVGRSLAEKGFRLKIFDAYRPQRAVRHFVRWAKDPTDIRMKEQFYPGLDKSTLFPLGYIAERSSHSRGSTVDLTIVHTESSAEADMGGSFDFFGEVSRPDFTGITGPQYANRMLLRDAMTAGGFLPLDEEWWHFTLAGEPYPDTYFDFPVNAGVLSFPGSSQGGSYE